MAMLNQEGVIPAHNDLGVRLYEISLQEVNHFRTCSIPVIPRSPTLPYSYETSMPVISNPEHQERAPSLNYQILHFKKNDHYSNKLDLSHSMLQ